MSKICLLQPEVSSCSISIPEVLRGMNAGSVLQLGFDAKGPNLSLLTHLLLLLIGLVPVCLRVHDCLHGALHLARSQNSPFCECKLSDKCLALQLYTVHHHPMQHGPRPHISVSPGGTNLEAQAHQTLKSLFCPDLASVPRLPRSRGLHALSAQHQCMSHSTLPRTPTRPPTRARATQNSHDEAIESVARE